jgi:hypothetical protein
LLEEHGLSVVPFLYVFSRDRLAWVTLNGPEPLLDIVPPIEARINSPKTAGQFEWEWSINTDFCDPLLPHIREVLRQEAASLPAHFDLRTTEVTATLDGDACNFVFLKKDSIYHHNLS